MTIKRGDIFYADLSPVVGSEQGGIRPVLIVQNDVTIIWLCLVSLVPVKVLLLRYLLHVLLFLWE